MLDVELANKDVRMFGVAARASLQSEFVSKGAQGQATRTCEASGRGERNVASAADACKRAI